MSNNVETEVTEKTEHDHEFQQNRTAENNALRGPAKHQLKRKRAKQRRRAKKAQK